MKSTTSGISRREVALLGEWEREGISRITTADLATTLAVSRPAAALILARLAHKGALDRVGRGVYGVRPMRAVSVPRATSALVAVAHLLAEHDYYVGGPVALTTHRLTQQVFHSVIDVFGLDRRPPLILEHARIIFHTVRDPDLLHLGVIRVPIDHVTVRMSDPERTLLDLVDRPGVFGSARSALATFRTGVGQVNVSVLITDASSWPRRSTRQRLGYVLEDLGVSRLRLAPLLAGKRPTHVVPLLVDEPAIGPIASPWRVRLNDGRDDVDRDRR